MAPKTKPAAEPSRPSIEAILTDIHNTLVEGFESLHSKLDEIHEAILGVSSDERHILTAAERADLDKTVSKPTIEQAVKAAAEAQPTPSDEEIPKFVRAYMDLHPSAKPADLVKEFKISFNKAAAAVKEFGKPAPAKAEAKITVEALRAKISEFAEAFNMNEALSVNEQFGGSRKVSGIPEVAYEKVFNEMDRRLKEKAVNEAPATPEDSVAVTKEDIQKAGGVFVKKYGDPAFRELLAKFVAKGEEAKISKVDPAKYAALHEALANA